ncbi:SRPBCC family protein [Baekduia sp.]|uniref:SRPBCC family protein n=1 Tax=Baekduia sp. TaxID=2600305 RepID=UPI002DFCADA0|nr:SRPBCC family protein [Baekduia sp.]
MDPLSVEVIIARPREEVFAYLADIANHAEFTDHYLVNWHLTREDSYGVGAGARYKVRARGKRYTWADSTITELVAPRLVVERGRTGKFNRNLTRGVYELDEASGASTRVTFTLETKPKLLSDRLQEIGSRGWLKRKNKKALSRLRSILEEGLDRGVRPSVAGGARKPASAFRFHPDVNR